MQSACHVAELVEGDRDLPSRLLDPSPGARVVVHAASEAPELEREGDQPLLGAVVEIALEPGALPLTGLEHAPARAPQLFEARLELGVQLPVLERQPRRSADGLEQLRLVAERPVVHQGRDRLALALDQRRRPLVVGPGQPHRPALGIRPDRILGEPVREAQRRIVQRARERRREVERRRHRAQLDHQLADRGAGQARVEQRDQKCDRGQADDDERRSLDRKEEALLGKEGAGEHQHGDHHQRERERIDQQGGGAPQWPGPGPAADGEHDDAAERERREGDQLDLPHRGREVGLGGERQHVLRAEAAEHQAEQLQPDGDRVRGADERPLEPAVEPPRREGEEDVQEDRDRDQVGRLSDRERQRRARRREARERGHEPGDHHQRPKAALRASPPRDQAAEDVGADDPVEQRSLQAGLGAAVIAGHPQHDHADRGRDAGEGDAPEDSGARSDVRTARATDRPDPEPLPRARESGHLFLSDRRCRYLGRRAAEPESTGSSPATLLPGQDPHPPPPAERCRALSTGGRARRGTGWPRSACRSAGTC